MNKSPEFDMLKEPAEPENTQEQRRREEREQKRKREGELKCSCTSKSASSRLVSKKKGIAKEAFYPLPARQGPCAKCRGGIIPKEKSAAENQETDNRHKTV